MLDWLIPEQQRLLGHGRLFVVGRVREEFQDVSDEMVLARARWPLDGDRHRFGKEPRRDAEVQQFRRTLLPGDTSGPEIGRPIPSLSLSNP